MPVYRGNFYSPGEISPGGIPVASKRYNSGERGVFEFKGIQRKDVAALVFAVNDCHFPPEQDRSSFISSNRPNAGVLFDSLFDTFMLGISRAIGFNPGNLSVSQYDEPQGYGVRRCGVITVYNVSSGSSSLNI